MGRREENATANEERACQTVDWFLQRTYDSLETVIGGDRAADLSNQFYHNCEQHPHSERKTKNKEPSTYSTPDNHLCAIPWFPSNKDNKLEHVFRHKRPLAPTLHGRPAVGALRQTLGNAASTPLALAHTITALRRSEARPRSDARWIRNRRRVSPPSQRLRRLR